jgi:hypothetical protein
VRVPTTEEGGLRKDEDGHEETPDDRTDLFAYLTAPQRSEYRAIMDSFTGPLLTDLSASEVAQQLADGGITLSSDDATARCDQLQAWGNLVRGVRTRAYPRCVTSCGRAAATRLSKHRDAEAVLAAGEGAQEAARPKRTVGACLAGRGSPSRTAHPGR